MPSLAEDIGAATSTDELWNQARPAVVALLDATSERCKPAARVEERSEPWERFRDHPAVVDVALRCGEGLEASLDGARPIVDGRSESEARRSGDVTYRIRCPSAYSDRTTTADVVATRSDAGKITEVVVALEAPKLACASGAFYETMVAHRTYVEKAVAPYRAGIDHAIAALASRCEKVGSATPAAALPSPAAGTELEADPRVLGVRAVCARRGGDVAFEALRDAGTPSSESGETFAMRGERRRTSVALPKSGDLATISVEQTTAGGVARLDLTVKAAGLPARPR